MPAKIIQFPSKQLIEVVCKSCYGVFYKKESDPNCAFCAKQGPFEEPIELHRTEFAKHKDMYDQMKSYAIEATGSSDTNS